jgi:hypothetical protein
MVNGKTAMKLKHTLKDAMSLLLRHHGVFFPLECMTRHHLSHAAVHEPRMHTVVYNDNANIFEIINSEQN